MISCSVRKWGPHIDVASDKVCVTKANNCQGDVAGHGEKSPVLSRSLSGQKLWHHNL